MITSSATPTALWERAAANQRAIASYTANAVRSGSIQQGNRKMDSQPQSQLHSPAHSKSKVWQHYGFYKKDGKLDKLSAICKLCFAPIKYTGSTTNLITHLKWQHSINIESESSSEPSSSRPSGSTRGEQDTATFFSGQLANNSARSKDVNNAISYFMCKALQPYSVTENEGFQYVLRVLEPRFKIPLRKFFTEKEIPALYARVRLEISKSLQRAQRVALTVDGWTSCATDSYITVTVHYVDNEWDLQSHVLQTRVFNESHTGINLSVLLLDVCQECKLEDKNPALVSDNAKNMVLAFSEAKLNPHVRCIAHTLNLASQKAFKVDEVSEILVKVKKLVTFFHKSPKASEILRETQRQLQLPAHKLIHDVSTRWNSSLDMLERFWEQQPAVLNALLSRKMKRGEALVTLTEEDMVLIPEITKLMTPLKVATTLLSEEKNPTLSMISPIQAKLKKHFQPVDGDLLSISKMKEQFTKDFSGRYNYLQDLLNTASALDPRFKDLAFLDDNDSKDMVFMKLTAEVVKINDEVNNVYPSNSNFFPVVNQSLTNICCVFCTFIFRMWQQMMSKR